MGTLLLILGDHRRKRLALAFCRLKPSGRAGINVESFLVEKQKLSRTAFQLIVHRLVRVTLAHFQHCF
jgi:hypothetical protein